MTKHEPPIIQIKNLWKEYGDNVVLERVNLSVQAGEFVSIVGASGCGKTTFLNLLLGIEEPSQGEILLDGQPLDLALNAALFFRSILFFHTSRPLKTSCWGRSLRNQR